MSSNQLTITDLGFVNINRKIINSRKFSDELISTEGNVTISDGIASKFNKESYLYKNDLALHGSDLTIEFEGLFLSSLSNSNQVAWYLAGSGNPIVFQFIKVDNESGKSLAYPQLLLPNGDKIGFNYLIFEDDTYFKGIVNFTSDSCQVLIDVQNDIFSKKRTLSSGINFSKYTSIIIGNDPTLTETEENYFWEGSVDIANFKIFYNDILFFSPTTGYSLNLCNIVVSDGTIPLPKGTPRSTSRHLYVYDIEPDDIAHSDNTLLVSAQIKEDSKLVIREIGLYAQSNGETFLFGYLTGLNIDKGAEVPYDLFIKVNLALSVVNVIGFPDVNSFVFNQIKPILLKDYIDVYEANDYVITNLERIVRMNSLEPISKNGYCFSRYSTTGVKMYGWTYIASEEPLTVYTTEYPISGLDTKLYEYDKESNDFEELSPSLNEFHIEAFNDDFIVAYESNFTIPGIWCCDNPVSIQSIGYNTPQVVYRTQKRIEEQQDCYSSVQTYSKLYKKISKTTKYLFDNSSILLNGEVQVSTKGEISNISNSNYVTLDAFIDNSKEWNLDLSFSISDYSSESRTLISINGVNYPEIDNSEATGVTLHSTNNSTAFVPYISLEIDTSNNLVATHFTGKTPYYAWTCYTEPSVIIDGETVDLPVIYTKEETVTSSTVLYNNKGEVVTPTQSGFHIDNNLIKYGTKSTERDTKFDLVFYSNPQTTTIQGNLKRNKKYYVTITGDNSAVGDSDSTSINIAFSNNKVDYQSTLVGGLASKESVTILNTLNVGVDYFCDSTLPNQPEGTPPNTLVGTISVLYYEMLHAWTYQGEDEEHVIYALDNPLSASSTLYDENSQEVQSEDYSIAWSGSEFIIRYQGNDMAMNEALNIPFNNPLTPEVSYINYELGEFQTSKPFLKNSINIADWSIRQTDNNWNSYSAVVVADAELLQYYHLPNYSRESYTIKDLCNPSYTVSFLDDTMTGNQDLIDFNNSSSLCLKVNLEDDSSKLLLAELGNNGNELFRLNLIKTPTIDESGKASATYDLQFLLVTTGEPITANISIDASGIAEYVSNPFLLTLIKNNDILYMYRNNELMVQATLTEYLPSFEGSHFTNHLPDYNIGRYIKDIIVTENALTTEQLFYITNLTDTNYKFTSAGNLTSVEDIPE